MNVHGYFLTRTSKAVRDRCIEEGSPIARASVNFILRGITFGGHRFGQSGDEDPLALGTCFFRNVVSLCDSAGISLHEKELEVLSDWILGESRREQEETDGNLIGLAPEEHGEPVGVGAAAGLAGGDDAGA